MRRLAPTAISLCLCLVPLGAQVADRHLEPAVERIEKNDAGGLRRLLARDPSLVRRTGAGVLPHWRWTLLHLATTEKASLDVVRALVDAGSDVNVRDNEGNTPLHFAVKRLSRETLPKKDYDGIIQLLLDNKADVHIVNMGGITPLHTAVAFRADPSAVETLIRAGALVNLKTLESFDGWTPLHGAAARGSAETIEVLLKHGADPAAKDGQGMTALQVAERHGFADAAKVLRASVAAPAANAPCTGFTLGSPANGESVGPRPMLRWDAFPEAARYVATVLAADDRIVISSMTMPADVTSVQLETDLPPGTYAWRVDAYNTAGGRIGCSIAPRRFIVRGK